MLNLFEKLLLGTGDYEIFPADYEVIKKGSNAFWHKHRWYRIRWDESLGNNYFPHDGQFVAGDTATCKYLLECRCGARVIMTKKEFI